MSSIFIFLLVLNMWLLILRIKSLLIMLFAFEFLVLNIFFMFSMKKMLKDISPSLVFLAVVAGEASLGLSLLVLIVRTYGKDNNKYNNLKSCEGY